MKNTFVTRLKKVVLKASVRKMTLLQQLVFFQLAISLNFQIPVRYYSYEVLPNSASNIKQI